MIELTANFGVLKGRQEALSNLLNESLRLFEKTNFTDWAETLRNLVLRVRSDRFKIIVLGEFKRGKSTFINALLGNEILPAEAVPCTAVINEIKWGDEKKAIIHFRDPLPKSFPGVPESVRAHIKNSPGRPTPMTVDVDSLREYVVIPDAAKDQSESVAETPYDHVEVYWPLNICKSGVEIIDSPGLNEHGVRQQITLDYMPNADAVIFVMSCHALGGQSEMRVIDQNVLDSGHKDIFFICNRFDEIKEKDRLKLEAYGKQKLRDKTSFKELGVYFISALDGLDAKREDNNEKLERSGLPRLETDLANFLLNERGRIKLLQPARELTIAVQDVLLKRIPTQKRLLQEDTLKLETRYKEKQPLLKDAEARKSQIISRLRVSAKRLENDIRREAAAWIRDCSEQVPEWVSSYNAKNDITIWEIKGFTAQAEELVKEVSNYIQERMEAEQLEWRNNKLKPLLASGIEEMDADVAPSVEELLQSIDRIRCDLEGADPRILEKARGKNISPLERVLAAAGGLIVAGVGSAVLGGAFGYMEMLRSLVPQIILGVGLAIVGITNPVAIIAALMTGGVVQGWWRAKAVANVVKMRVAEEAARTLEKSVDQSAEEILKPVNKLTTDLIQSIELGLKREICAIRDQVESALKDKQRGDQAVRMKIAMFEQAEFELSEINSGVQELVFDLAQKY